MTFWNDPSRVLLKQQHRWVISFGDKDYNSPESKIDPLTKNKIYNFFAKSVDKPSFDIKTTQARFGYSHTFNFPQRLVWNPITITLYDVFNRKIKFVKKTVTTRPINASNTLETVTSFTEILSDESAPGNNSIAASRTLLDPIVGEGQQSIFSKNGLFGVSDANVSTQLFFYKFLQEAGYIQPDEFEKEDFLLRFKLYNFKQSMVNALSGKSKFQLGTKSSEIFKNSNLDYNDPLTKKKFIDTETWPKIKIHELDDDGNVTETWELYNPLVTSVKSDRLDYSGDAATTITVGLVYDWAKLVPTDTREVELHQVVRETESIREFRRPSEIDTTGQSVVGTDKLKSDIEDETFSRTYGTRPQKVPPTEFPITFTNSQKAALAADAAFRQQSFYDKLDQEGFSDSDLEALRNNQSVSKDLSSAAAGLLDDRNSLRFNQPNNVPQEIQNAPSFRGAPAEQTGIAPASVRDVGAATVTSISLEGAGSGVGRTSNQVNSFSVSADDIPPAYQNVLPTATEVERQRELARLRPVDEEIVP